MSELREYRADVTGRAGAVPTTLLLSAEDAEAQGLSDADLVKGGVEIDDTAPEIDARTTYGTAPANGSTDGGDAGAPAKALDADEAAELEKLRRENAELRAQLADNKEADVKTDGDDKSAPAGDDKGAAPEAEKAEKAPANKSRTAAANK